MIHSKDLRIGNLVYVTYALDTENNQAIILAVTEILEDFTGLKNLIKLPRMSIDGRFSNESLQPIPLTIELLEKNFGFIAKKGSGNLFDYKFYVKNGFTIAVKMHGLANGLFEFGSIVQLGGEYNSNGERFDRVRYVGSVHQMQNIYYDLKNEELTLNLCTATTQNDPL